MKSRSNRDSRESWSPMFSMGVLYWSYWEEKNVTLHHILYWITHCSTWSLRSPSTYNQSSIYKKKKKKKTSPPKMCMYVCVCVCVHVCVCACVCVCARVWLHVCVHVHKSISDLRALNSPTIAKEHRYCYFKIGWKLNFSSFSISNPGGHHINEILACATVSHQVNLIKWTELDSHFQLNTPPCWPSGKVSA